MSRALYPGTFDPIHNGHLDIAQRALRLFDEVVVGVYDRPNKALLFSAEERLGLALEAMRALDGGERAKVVVYHGLTVEFARQAGAGTIVRGLRNSVDFDYEWQMAQTNHWMARDVEIVCLFANAPYSFVSATLVREVFTLGGDVHELVPAHVTRALLAKRPASQAH
ncbi:MAG: pantetheine-phosphate adenylyltransferase [Thermoflexales bacterium]|nr:pantetheine-phosphate adenylyltransferase [Thermoflexales bacterium]